MATTRHGHDLPALCRQHAGHFPSGSRASGRPSTAVAAGQRGETAPMLKRPLACFLRLSARKGQPR